MNVKIEEVEKNKVKIEIEVGPDVLEDGLNKSYKKNARRFNVPGFRKGRAPRSIVERYYGVESLYEGAVDEICPEYYEKAVKDNGLEPVDSPELDLVELERGKPFIFSATVIVKPEVTLGQYKGVEVPYSPTVVTDDDIEQELKSVADSNARLIPVEDRPAKEGDVLLIDYEGFIDGIAFEGGKKEGHSLELGKKEFIEGFEDQLIGKNADEQTEVNVRFPDNYYAEELKGKDAVFNVTVHSIKEKELPAIDDDFAQDVSEFETLEEYRADIRKHLTEHQEEHAKEDFERELLQKIVEAAQSDIPETMISRQAERDEREFEMSLAYQGMDIDRYLEFTSTTRESFNETMQKRAANEVKTRLVLDKIGKDEAIDISDEEFDGEMQRRADVYKKDLEEYRAQVSDDLAEYIRAKMKSDKIVAFLTENAVKTQ